MLYRFIDDTDGGDDDDVEDAVMLSYFQILSTTLTDKMIREYGQQSRYLLHAKQVLSNLSWFPENQDSENRQLATSFTDEAEDFAYLRSVVSITGRTGKSQVSLQSYG